MKKLIFVFMFLALTLSGCSSSETVWVNMELPYLVYFEMGDIQHGIDLSGTDIEFLDVEVVSSLNTDTVARIENKSALFYTYNPNWDNPQMLDFFDFDGHPLFLYNATVKVKIYKKDLEKLKADVQKYGSISFSDNTLSFNYCDFTMQNFYTGELINVSYNIDRSNLKKSLSKLESIFMFNARKLKDDYIQSNKELVTLVQSLVDGVNDDKAKAKILTEWVYENIQPLPDDLFKQAITLQNKEGNKISGADWVWNKRQGFCRSVAYLLKTMLDIAEIENKFITGYVPNGDGHVLNAILDKDTNKWLWLDGTTGGFDVPGMYESLERHEILELPD